MIKVTDTIYPIKEKVDLYNIKYNKYAQIYPCLRELFRK